MLQGKEEGGFYRPGDFRDLAGKTVGAVEACARMEPNQAQLYAVKDSEGEVLFLFDPIGIFDANGQSFAVIPPAG